MIIMESAIAMNADYVECTNTLGKIGIFAEAAYKEYEINLKEVALKVLKENGTEEDFDFLATEAAAGYIERAKKAIMKIVEAVRKFIRNCKDRLINMVTNAKTNAAVDKVEEVCKSNSKFRAMKVEYQDTDKQVGALQQGIDRIRKKVAKVKAKGKATEKDIEEVQEIESDTMKKVAAISVVTVSTIATAIAIFKHCNSRSEVDNALNENALSDCDISIDSDTTQDAITADYYIKASGAIAKLKKEKTAKKVVKSTSLLAAIKSAVSKAKGKIKSENLEEQMHESVLEDLAMFAYVAESVEDEIPAEEPANVETESVGTVEGLDLDNYFTELCDELFTNVTESTEESTDVSEVVEENAETTEEVAEEITEESVNDANVESIEVSEVVEENAETTEEVAEEITEESAEETNVNFTEVSEVVEENTETEIDEDQFDLATYMEQLEHDVFGEDENVVEENTEEENSEEITEETTAETEDEVATESVDDEFQSLLDEMEALL